MTLPIVFLIVGSLVALAWLLRPRKLTDRENVHDPAWAPSKVTQRFDGYDQRLAFQKARAARRKSETGRVYRKPSKPKGADVVPMPKRSVR